MEVVHLQLVNKRWYYFIIPRAFQTLNCNFNTYTISISTQAPKLTKLKTEDFDLIPIPMMMRQNAKPLSIRPPPEDYYSNEEDAYAMESGCDMLAAFNKP